MQLPGVARRLVLVRHGRSAHAPGGLLHADELAGWLERYDAAGIAPGQRPPARLLALAGRAGLVVHSDLRRAAESAALLAPGVPTMASPLLRELDLWLPRGRRVHLPLALWALVIGAGRALAAVRASDLTDAQREQVARAAAWLSGLGTARTGLVIAVTHASVRRRITRELITGGWTLQARQRHARPWSAWVLAPPAPAGPRS